MSCYFPQHQIKITFLCLVVCVMHPLQPLIEINSILKVAVAFSLVMHMGSRDINCYKHQTVLISRKVIFRIHISFQDSHNVPFDHFDICPNTHDSLVLPRSIPDVNYDDTPSQKSSIIIRTWSTPSSPQHTRINSNSKNFYLNDYQCHTTAILAHTLPSDVK